MSRGSLRGANNDQRFGLVTLQHHVATEDAMHLQLIGRVDEQGTLCVRGAGIHYGSGHRPPRASQRDVGVERPASPEMG